MHLRYDWLSTIYLDKKFLSRSVRTQKLYSIASLALKNGENASVDRSTNYTQILQSKRVGGGLLDTTGAESCPLHDEGEFLICSGRIDDEQSTEYTTKVIFRPRKYHHTNVQKGFQLGICAAMNNFECRFTYLVTNRRAIWVTLSWVMSIPVFVMGI